MAPRAALPQAAGSQKCFNNTNFLFLTTYKIFSEKLRGMREHLCLKVKVLERTIRTSNSRIGFSDMLRNTDNKGVWKFGQTLWEQACTDVLRLEEYI